MHYLDTNQFYTVCKLTLTAYNCTLPVESHNCSILNLLLNDDDNDDDDDDVDDGDDDVFKICISVAFNLNLCSCIVSCEYCFCYCIHLAPLKIAWPGAVDLQERGYHTI